MQRMGAMSTQFRRGPLLKPVLFGNFPYVEIDDAAAGGAIQADRAGPWRNR